MVVYELVETARSKFYDCIWIIREGEYGEIIYKFRCDENNIPNPVSILDVKSWEISYVTTDEIVFNIYI